MPILVDAALQIECLSVAGVIAVRRIVIGGKANQRVGGVRQVTFVHRLGEQQVIMRPVFRREVVGIGMQRIEQHQGTIRLRRHDRLDCSEVHHWAVVASHHHAEKNEP